MVTGQTTGVKIEGHNLTEDPAILRFNDTNIIFRYYFKHVSFFPDEFHR